MREIGFADRFAHHPFQDVDRSPTTSAGFLVHWKNRSVLLAPAEAPSHQISQSMLMRAKGSRRTLSMKSRICWSKMICWRAHRVRGIINGSDTFHPAWRWLGQHGRSRSQVCWRAHSSPTMRPPEAKQCCLRRKKLSKATIRVEAAQRPAQPDPSPALQRWQARASR